MGKETFPAGILLEHPMEHLPSADDVPILKELQLGKLTEAEFRDKYAIPTPVDSDGLVDSEQLIKQVTAFARPEYKWLSPFFDKHHLNWPGADYNVPTQHVQMAGTPYMLARKGNGQVTGFYEEVADGKFESLSSFENQEIYNQLLEFSEAESFDETTYDYFDTASRFRESESNMIWISRQAHNFIHLITIPADHPTLEVMESVNAAEQQAKKADRRRSYLSRIAADAIGIRERLDRATPVQLLGGGVLLVDREKKRVYQNPEAMEGRREWAIKQIVEQHNRGFIDLKEVAPLGVIDKNSVEESLYLIARRLIDFDVDTPQHNGRRLMKADLPTRGAKYSVWLRDNAERDVA